MNRHINGILLVISFLLASIMIYYTVSGEEVNFEDFALGEFTSSNFEFRKDRPIHIDKITKDAFTKFYSGWEERGEKEVLLILGNSQTHGINKILEGQINYSAMMHDSIQDYDVLTHSLPNANLQEHLLSFSYLIDTFPVKYLILPVFMDDLRETGIRHDYFDRLIETNYHINDTSDVATVINLDLDHSAIVATNDNTTIEKSKLIRDVVEEELDLLLSESTKAWAAREQMRGKLFTNLYLLRNTFFGISAQTKRPLIESRKKLNYSALNVILRKCFEENVKVLLYIPPIRLDVDIPYLSQEYENFKRDMQDKCSRYDNIVFKNFEDIVPGQYWGVKSSTNLLEKEEYDFMHFEFRGHEILFDSLITSMNEIIVE